MRANLAEPMAPRALQQDPSTVVAEPLLKDALLGQ